MADTHGHADAGHGDHGHGNVFRMYMIVAAALAVCTAMSFVINQFVENKMMAFLLILMVAILKAGMVGYIFMHLRWDWDLLYFLIVPVSILGVMMAIVFLPDIFFGALHDARDQLEISHRFAEMMKK